MRTKNGQFRPDTIRPMLLDATDGRYHPDAVSFLKEGPVVMYTTGAKWSEGSLPGEHDGIRDGGSSPRADKRRNHVVYVPLADWLAAGFPKP